MNGRLWKLVRLGLSPEEAEKVGAAGMTYPSDIRKATDTKLREIPGFGPATVARIRQRFPKVK